MSLSNSIHCVVCMGRSIAVYTRDTNPLPSFLSRQNCLHSNGMCVLISPSTSSCQLNVSISTVSYINAVRTSSRYYFYYHVIVKASEQILSELTIRMVSRGYTLKHSPPPSLSTFSAVNVGKLIFSITNQLCISKSSGSRQA